MEKKIAFNNMIALISDSGFKKPDIEKQYKISLQYGEAFDSEYLQEYRQDDSFAAIPGTSGIYSVETVNGRFDIPFALKGWIGIHSSIEPKDAKKNDNRFVKNKYYNPNKLRLYIRNKLAVEDFLGYIKNTQQGVNYIEGEISFDLLDDNRLDDITTSNRQDVDIHDPRVSLLIDIVKKIVSKLIRMRNAITEKVSNENRRRKQIIESNAKKNAQQAIRKDLLGLGMDAQQTNDVMVAVESKFKGTPDLAAKEIFKVFISHSKRDRRFSDFLYNLLRLKGAKETDIFYTTHEVGAHSNLSNNIKANIAENNVLVLFLDSVHSIRSQYCLFEGGAFWATRSVEDCIHIHFNTGWIPDYINDNEVYHVPLNTEKKVSEMAFMLTAKKYNEISGVLNIVIEHLNNSITHNTSKIPLFDHVDFPTELELSRSGKSVLDYMDKDFVDCWKLYVVGGETDLSDNGTKRTREEFIQEYNELVDKM